jgi:chlorobactene glucosyltransferase
LHNGAAQAGLGASRRERLIVELALSIGWLIVVIWLIARAVGQRGLLLRLDPVVAPAPGGATVAVIVPARDEEANIGRCLQSLIQQTYPIAQTRIVVIDDQSRDRTREIVAALAQRYGRMELLRSPPLPPDWTGKSHACAIGAEAAAASDWLCFLDADVWAEPTMIASAIAYAGREALDLISLSPRQQLKSFAERLIMPCGFYLLAFCQDLRRVQSRDSAATTVTGQCMLIRRTAYETVGGHGAVHGAICEDLELGLLIKRLRGQVRLVDGSALLSTRMYSDASSLWLGISKNLVDMLQGEGRTLAIAAAALILAWASLLIPLFDAIGCAHDVPGACLALWSAALASGAAFGLHIAGAVHFRIPPWYGLLFPLGYTIGALIALDSIRRRRIGAISWKGRTYKSARS